MKDRRSFIERLAHDNREFYGTSEGRGALRALELTFENRWIYLFELVQNALDAGAHSIALRLTEDGDTLICQHDGNRSLREQDVEGLSKIFRSTKGASSVGFMGIGFKSIFRRFLEARISGWGWTFRYEITPIKGERYGDLQLDLLGAVVPIWDGAVAAPESGFTTRFEMRRRADGGADLQADLAHFISDDDHTLLAILAASELKRLELNGRVWKLSISKEPDETLEAAAFSEGESRRWRLFPVWFEPSREAIARFLEHRKIQPSEDEREEVYAQAARPRRVLGVLPLDDNGMPAPPPRGRVHATLPTAVTLPFGLHINADWLLNISRTGVGEVEDNAWQRDIVDRVADVLASFLGWSAHTFADPAAIKAAFAVFTAPSIEAGGLEALFAEERWLFRLRTRLEDEAVLPVYAEESTTLAFARPGDLILPPTALAKAFEEQPALRPAMLLKKAVLMEDVLGSGARDLLCRAGLLAEMSPQDLEQAWPDGLSRWWETLGDEQETRRALLFRIWAAVAELTSKDPWQDADIPCIRTATGQWLPVSKVVFFDEHFPSKREPGGAQVHQFIRRFIPDANRLPDGWIDALRKEVANENWTKIALSQALKWVESHARHISIREVVGEAIDDLDSSSTPDWSVLTTLGHWAKHRNRSDLLTRVLVESNTGPRGIPAQEALLADPYVEHGQGRRLLFSTKSVISATYLEQDPKRADVRDWRTFFERAHVKGKWEVRPVESRVGRWNTERVARFLGVEVSKIPESNKDGYKLLDFDIKPNLPDPNESEELRKTLAAWIEDGYKALEGKGRRKTRYTYYNTYCFKGNELSVWVTKLSKIAWIPCHDGEIRCPQDVLPQVDPEREDAPVASLSSEFLRVLEQEGVRFGTAIPETPALRKLSTAGSRLDAEELARLLRECREQITTDEDRGHLREVLQTLTVPSSDNRRVSLDRIVQRVGGRLRGALGGWIVPLDRINEVLRDELKHPDVLHEFPDTTTGEQSLAYIRDVWKRAGPSSEGLANDVRDVLPVAYAYCLEDCDRDGSLYKRWCKAVPDAAVFAEREWVVLAEARDLYFDDINDRRFLPVNMQLRTVTSGHLGNSWPDQLRTAKALHLELLSSSVKMKWHEDEELCVPDDWKHRFALVCRLLRWVRGKEGGESDGTGMETGMGTRLNHVRELVLDVSIGNAPAERVPVDARLNENVLTVTGRPVQFGADAAKELLRYFSFGQRGDLAADLTGMLGTIDDASGFKLAAAKFQRSFAPDFELPVMSQCESDAEQSAGSWDDVHREPIFPERSSQNPEQRESRFVEEYTQASQREYRPRERSVRTTRRDIDPVISLRNQYTNDKGQMICQICQEAMPFKKSDGEYYFEAVEALSGFPKEHEAQYLALCPLCAAMYKCFVKDDEATMKELHRALKDSEELELPLKLGEWETTIRFVETHLGDMRIILRSFPSP